MARLYANENFPRQVVEELRALGHDVVTVQERERGNEGMPDPEVLSLATAEERVVVTLNRRDFIRLHGISTFHAGIIVCTVDADFRGQAQRIHDAILTYPDLAGRLIRVNRPEVLLTA